MHTGTHIFLSNPANPNETLPSNARSYRRGRPAPAGFLGAYRPGAGGHTHLAAYGVAQPGATYLGQHLHLADGPPAASAAGRNPWGAVRSPHGARLSAGVHASARVPWGAERNPYGPRGGLGQTSTLATTELTYLQWQELTKLSAPPPPAAMTGGEQAAAIITAGTSALSTLWGGYMAQQQQANLFRLQQQQIAAGMTPTATTVSLTPRVAPVVAPVKKETGMGMMMLPLLAVGAMMMMGGK